MTSSPWTRRCAFAVSAAALALSICGCFTDEATPPTDWTKLCMEKIPELGDSLLKSDTCQSEEGAVLLQVGGMLDKTRFLKDVVDADLLMKAMRTHLVNNGGGRIVVLDNDADVAELVKKRRLERAHDAVRAEVKYLAGRIVRASVFGGGNVKMAVMPTENLSPEARNVNVDGALEFLRDEIAAQGRGRFMFLSADRSPEADYLLKGSLSSFGGRGAGDPADLNLRIVVEKPASAGEACFEVSLPIRKKAFDSSLDATYLLSGELNELTHETRDHTGDIVRMGFNLVDLDTREHKWEGACNISVTTKKPILYQ